eukprot:6061474-Lingulodinium_polyedra.AAC.1
MGPAAPCPMGIAGLQYMQAEPGPLPLEECSTDEGEPSDSLAAASDAVSDDDSSFGDPWRDSDPSDLWEDAVDAGV